METKDVIVAMFDKHSQAETAVRELQRSGFDMKTLSIVGKGYHTDEHVVGYYNAGDRMMYWGSQGAFWGGFWGLLFGSAFFWVPGLGPLLIAGPMVGWIVGAMEGAVVVGGFSALGGALASVGIPNDSVLAYESSIKAGKFMMVMHGTNDEVTRAKGILSASGATTTQLHPADARVVAIL